MRTEKRRGRDYITGVAAIEPTLLDMKARDKRSYGKAFGLGALLSAIILLPFVIYNGGTFIFAGDYNVQQIPFQQVVHDAVWQGSFLWNWFTDLGVNLIASYSFYNIGSPFFLLFLPFPNAWLPYLMAPVLCLKFGVMSLTAYAYIRRFVKTDRFAVIGGLLYAFSGFSIYNIFFNHFHDVMAFFPLMLLGLEHLLVDKRGGLFAAATALCCITNYFFFIGEVVFAVLYFFVRITTGDIGISWKRLGLVLFEAVLGVMVAMVIFLPSILNVLDNPRTGELINGWNFLTYYYSGRYPAILQAFLFPADICYSPMYFEPGGVKWISSAGWLPMFSTAGTLAWLFSKKRDFFKRMILFSLLFMLIPGLNSIFYMFNTSTYARWYYMPVLLMALVSVKGLEEPDVDIKRGIKWTLIATVAITLFVGLMPNYVDGELVFGLSDQPAKMWCNSLIALLALLGFTYLVLYYRRHPRFGVYLQRALAVFIVISGCYYIAISKGDANHDRWLQQTCINKWQEIEMPEGDPFYRVDYPDGPEQEGMFMKLPTIQTFHSVVPGSIMEFYPSVGVSRDVASRPGPEHYTLRGYLSVKYAFMPQDSEVEMTLPGFTYIDEQEGFKLYENDHFIPMGTTYDAYYDDNTFEFLSSTIRERMLVKALYLEPEDVERYGGLLPRADSQQTFSEAAYLEDCDVRAETAAYFFEYDNTGFTARIDLPHENFVHFTVPYDKGWTATVNGEPAEVIKVNKGMMAVIAPAGNVEIRFDFMPRGLLIGLLCTGAGLVILVIYWVMNERSWRRRRRELVLSGGWSASSDELDARLLPDEALTGDPVDASGLSIGADGLLKHTGQLTFTAISPETPASSSDSLGTSPAPDANAPITGFNVRRDPADPDNLSGHNES